MSNARDRDGDPAPGDAQFAISGSPAVSSGCGHGEPGPLLITELLIP